MSHLYQDAEQFIRGQYWEHTHDKDTTIDIVELVQSRLKEDATKKDPDYYDKRPGVVHVSSLSKCLRGVVLELLGAKPDDQDEYQKNRKLGVFQAGNLFEEFIINTLGDKILERQREYKHEYKGLTIVGRSDGRIQDGAKKRVIEVKSVHSDSFWYRQRSGDLIAYQNQIQLQTYLWLERVLGISQDDGIFFYVSKDDVTVEGATVRFNQNFVDNIILPALDIVADAYAAKNPELAPVPPAVVFNKDKNMWQKNWLATYCEFHCQCAGANWILEAEKEVKQKNKELKEGLGSKFTDHLTKKEKPTINVVQ